MSEHLTDVKEVQRFDLKGNQRGDAWVGRHADGPFVRYDEHLDIVLSLRNRIAELERQFNKAVIERAWALGAFRADQPPDGDLLRLFAEWAAGASCDDEYAPQMVKHIAAIAKDALSGDADISGYPAGIGAPSTTGDG